MCASTEEGLYDAMNAATRRYFEYIAISMSPTVLGTGGVSRISDPSACACALVVVAVAVVVAVVVAVAVVGVGGVAVLCNACCAVSCVSSIELDNGTKSA
jgi:hypothetical protein